MTEQTPIFTQYREGNQDNPYVYKDENLIIDKNAKAFLTEFPERLYGVEVESAEGELFYETQELAVRENEFRIDYESKTKAVTFHASRVGQQLNFKYKGTGLSFISPTQIYTELDDDGVMQTLDQYIKEFSRIKTAVLNQLEKGAVNSVAGKTGIVTNGDIHVIETVLDGNAGNTVSTLPLGITVYTLNTHCINYPETKGFVVTYKHNNAQTVQFFYPTKTEASHFRSWVNNTWTDWKTLTTKKDVDTKIEQSALRTNTKSVLVGRAVSSVNGLNDSIDLGGKTGTKRLVKDDYRLEFVAQQDAFIERISFPVNGRGKVVLKLSEKNATGAITLKESRELYLQPIDVSHLVMLPIQKGKTYQLSLDNSSVPVLFETNVNAKDIASNAYIKSVQLLNITTITTGYAYFYDMKFSHNPMVKEIEDARVDYWDVQHDSLKESMDAIAKPLDTLTKEVTAARVDYLGKEQPSLKKSIDSSLNYFENIENGLDLETFEPMFVGNLATYRNAVLQTFDIDPETNQFYATQADGKTPEGFVLSQISPNGSKLLSTMKFTNGGHGTTFGLENDKGTLYIWSFIRNGANVSKLIRVPYKANTVIADSPSLKDYTPKSLKGIYFTPVVDSVNGYMLIRRGDMTCELRNLSDIKNGVDKALYTVNIPDSERTDERSSQGSVSFGTTLYWYSGVTTTTARVTKYDFKTNRLIGTREFDFPTETGKEFTDGYREPEGLAYYVNPHTGKESLLMGITTGEMKKRYNMVYALHQRGAQEHFTSMQALGSQNYAITRGDGRAHSLPEGITKLSDLRAPGEYYLNTATVETLTDLPSPQFKGAGLFISNSATNQNYNLRQVITRFSTSRKNLMMERSIKYNGTFGVWSVHESNSNVAENIKPADYGYKLSNVIYAGEYYFNTESSTAFTDHPEKDVAGWWLKVSSGNLSGGFVQELIKYSKLQARHYQRVLNPDGAGEWIMTIDVK